MKTLFDPIEIGHMQLKNRMIRSATFEGCGDINGRVTPELAAIYEKLAQGGVGAIITGMVGIDNHSRISTQMLKAYEDVFIEDFRQIADIVHRYGSKVIVQLSHCGVKASCTDSGVPVGPSPFAAFPGTPAAEVTKEEIKDIVKSFAAAAVRCKEAGADGVQIHGAHGYLLSQFLSPVFNKRTDAYGGALTGRAQIVFEVYDAIRGAVGGKYPVWIKINSTDMHEAGVTAEECSWVCAELERRGIDAIEISGGIGISRESAPVQVIKGVEEEGTFAENAIVIADKLRVPVISVGGYRTPEIAEEYLNKGDILAISLSRPLTSEPDLPDRWKNGNREKSRCISCNKCFDTSSGFGCKAFQ